uniref:Uncharacterized protein n=1 Tax=Glossina brevipalpis TaxID=37001 RepID=A0A1A9WLQ3_9MUSC
MFLAKTKCVSLCLPFISNLFLQASKRCYITKDCPSDDEQPKCDTLDKEICKKEILELNERIFHPVKDDVIMWKWPECSNNVCPTAPIRMDELYYKMSDKRNRRYRQTWASCPQPRVQQIQCRPLLVLPEMGLRPRKRQSACRFARPIKGLLPCRLLPKPLCNLCPKGRTDCRQQHKKSSTKRKKEPNPYPCYAECDRFERDSTRKIECKCLNRHAICEMWEKFRQRLTFVKDNPDKFALTPQSIGFYSMPKESIQVQSVQKTYADFGNSSKGHFIDK